MNEYEAHQGSYDHQHKQVCNAKPTISCSAGLLC